MDICVTVCTLRDYAISDTAFSRSPTKRPTQFSGRGLEAGRLSSVADLGILFGDGCWFHGTQRFWSGTTIIEQTPNSREFLMWLGMAVTTILHLGH
jgi:hypothetical protein